MIEDYLGKKVCNEQVGAQCEWWVGELCLLYMIDSGLSRNSNYMAVVKCENFLWTLKNGKKLQTQIWTRPGFT